MKGKFGDKVRLQHIMDAIYDIELYLEGISNKQFLENSEKRFATIKQLEIIGEACNALTDDLKFSYPSVPWKPIIDLEIFRSTNILE